MLDQHEQVVGEVRVRASRRQRDELVASPHRSCRGVGKSRARTGTGALLAQQLVAVGEVVLDVPPTLSARARLLDTARIDKTDAHNARAAAVVALRHSKLQTVMLRTTRRCCVSSRNATTTWSRIAPGPSVGCTPCWS